MPSALDQWFIHEILIHEESLMRYLQRTWPHRDEVHDLRQDLYVRIYEAAAKSFPSQPKAFLFASARHLMTDRLRRSKVVSIEPMGDFEPSHVLRDEVTPERWSGGLAAGAWWRSERQTFLPLPALQQAVFTIHVGVQPLAEVLAASPGRAARLHEAIASMSPAVLAYRGLEPVREALLAWLAERAAPA